MAKQKIPSVSAIIGQLDKPALLPWAVNSACDYISEKIQPLIKLEPEGVPSISLASLLPIVNSARKNYREIAALAINRGKEVHAAIEAHLKGLPIPPLSAIAQPAFEAFLKWKEATEITETVETELGFTTDTYKGRIDWICRKAGKLYVIDFKVAKGIYSDNRYQVAAYRNALKDLEGSGILRLDRETGAPEWVDTEDTYKQDLRVFNALVALWEAKNSGDE